VAIPLGNIRIYKARTEKACDLCKKLINSDRYYIMSTGRSRGTWFTHRYHLECYPQYIIDKIRERQKNPKSNKKKTNRLDGLTVEQIRRRETLQIYLVGKDKVRLIKAYQAKDTAKVYRAYSIIATRWIELQQMGKPFRTTLLSRKKEYWSDNDKELSRLLLEHDWMWMSQFDEADTERKIAMMLSRESAISDLQPSW
jgi:hypothetical protein